MNALPNSLEITGKTIDGNFSKNITVNSSKNTKGLDILWARRKIDRLTDIHNNSYKSSVEELSKKDIIGLALEYHLVSKFTSLVAVDVTPVRPESELLINQAIIKKAKADGLENELRLDEDGNLENRNEILQEFIAKLSTEKASAARSTAAYQAKIASALMAELAVEHEIASFEAELRAQVAHNMSPVRLVASSQTATNSELFMYLGALILLLTSIFRRRLLS